MSERRFLEDYFDSLIKYGLIVSAESFRRYLDYLFKDIVFENKSVLDVGGGSGLFSFYAAYRGAREVVCLEPESSGSRCGVHDKFMKLQSVLNKEHIIKLENSSLQEFNHEGKFDIIILHNSINHLDEGACSSLLNNRQAERIYLDIFKKLCDLANNHAKLIITDCSRYNFFGLLKLNNPFSPNIDWFKHQSPGCWVKFLKEAGFSNPKIRWRSSRLFGKGYILTKLLLNNKFALYFIDSKFSLIMEKCGG